MGATYLFSSNIIRNETMPDQLLILHLIDSGGMYGAESVIINLSSEMKKMGHIGVVGCISYQKDPLPEIGCVAEEKGLKVALFRMKNKLDLGVFKKIKTYCRENKIQLIHAHGYKASLICFFLQMIYGTPYVVTCHLWEIDDFKHRFYIFLESLAMRRAKKVIGVSGEIKKDLLRARIPQELIRVVKNGIDISFYDTPHNFRKADFKKSIGISEDARVVTNIGRLSEQKDQATLLKGAQLVIGNICDVEFVIVGEGHLREDLEALSVQLGIEKKVHFLGFRKDISAILDISEVFVLTSLNEGLPIVLLEAMGKKIPVITTGVGEIPNIIEDGVNGILIPVSDQIAFSERLLDLLRDESRATKIAENAYETFLKSYTSRRMAREYLDIYENILCAVD